MIDWLSINIEVPHVPIPAGRIVAIKADGSVDWETPQRMPIEGSYSNRVTIRSQGGDGKGNANELFISGCPAKFLQGHNVFGSNDIINITAGMVEKIFATLNIENDLAMAMVRRGEFLVKRIDITHSYELETRAIVLSTLSALAMQTRSRMGRAESKGSTVYHGKHSSRYAVKFYCKAEELESRKKGHALPKEERFAPVKEFAENLLRVELVIKSKELKENGLTHGYHFTVERVVQLHREYLEKIEMIDQVDIPSDVIMSMGRAIRCTYLIWKEGIDPRPSMTKPTYYNHRRQIIKYGVDIALPCTKVKCNVIPLFRTVTVAKPVGIPEFAYEEGLVFDPKRAGG